MTVARSPEYRQATWRVLRWAAWYTRGLDREVAGERLDELASDLHDHAVWAEQSGLSSEEATRAITRRGIRGVFDDLSWRRAQVRRGETTDPLIYRSQRQGSRVMAAVVTVGVLLVVVGGFALTRTLQLVIAQGDSAVASVALGLSLFLLLALAGIGLLALPRARWIGAVVLMVAAVGVVRFTFMGLLYGSAAVNHLMYFSQWWPLPKYALIAALVLFFGSAVLWWWPSRPAAEMSNERVR